MNIRDYPVEDRLEVVRLIDAVDAARRTAHAVGNLLPEMREWAEETEALYARLTASVGVAPKPVFDADEHIRQRVATGHPDFALFEGSHGEDAPIQPPPAAKEAETVGQAAKRLLEAGWNFEARMHAWEDRDFWIDEIEDLMAYNFGPGDVVQKRGTKKTGAVTEVMVGPDGEVVFNVDGIGMIRDDQALDVRRPHYFWGAVVVDHGDDSIYAVEHLGDGEASVWRIDADPEKAVMRAYRATSRRELVLAIFGDTGNGCIVGEFAVVPSAGDDGTAILVSGLDVEKASREAVDDAWAAVSRFEARAPEP